jgi:hypothetical protein
MGSNRVNIHPESALTGGQSDQDLPDEDKPETIEKLYQEASD